MMFILLLFPHVILFLRSTLDFLALDWLYFRFLITVGTWVALSSSLARDVDGNRIVGLIRTYLICLSATKWLCGTVVPGLSH